MSNYQINVICSCGGFSSQLNFIISWLTAIYDTNHTLDFNHECQFGHCVWKKIGFNKSHILENLFEEIKFNTIDTNYDNMPPHLSSEKHTSIKNSVIYSSWSNTQVNSFRNPRIEVFSEQYKFSLVNHYNTYIHQNFNKLRNYIHQVYVNKLIPRKCILDKRISFDKKSFIIGIHLRSAQHYKLEKYTTRYIVNEYITIIKNLKINNLKIYVATHLNQILQSFITEFGSENVYYHPTILDNSSIDEQNFEQHKKNDWMVQKNQISKYGHAKYLTDIYLDILNLANCKLVIGGPSNIFWNVLMLNNKLNFIIPKIFKGVNCR